MKKEINSTISLSFSNVGGFEGKKSYEFIVGKLHEIRGANTSGKTSLYKALVAPLSIPINAEFKFEEEAELFGIKKKRSNISYSFVNSSFESANSEVLYKKKIWKYSVKRDGTIIEINPGGDDTFLLVGILSRYTKLYQQIMRDIWDFKWFIDELSTAKRYESIAKIVSHHRREIERKLLEARQLQNKKNSIHSTIVDLKKEINEYSSKLKELTNKVVNLEELTSFSTKLVELEKKKNEISKYIKRKKNSLSNIENEKNNEEKKLQKIEEKQRNELRDLEKISFRLNEIGDLDKRQKEFNKEFQKLEGEKYQYAKLRDEISGVINLLTIALESLTEGTPKCPLCFSMNLNYNQISERLKEYRKKYNSHQSKVIEIIEKQDKLKNEFEYIEKEKNKLEDRKEKIIQNQPNYENLKIAIKQGLKSTIQVKNAHKKELKILEEDFTKINEQIERITTKSEKGREIFQERQNIEVLLSRKNELLSEKERQLNNISIEFEDFELNPETSINILNNIKNTLNMIESELIQEAEKQRRETRNIFNKSISEVLNRLGFKNLGTFSLNPDYLLIRKIDDKIQDMESLAESERIVLATVLLLSAKKVYFPEIPLFLIDDLYNDLDDKKNQLLTKYLAEIAIKEKIAILYTCLDETQSTIKIGIK